MVNNALAPAGDARTCVPHRLWIHFPGTDSFLKQYEPELYAPFYLGRRSGLCFPNPREWGGTPVPDLHTGSNVYKSTPNVCDRSTKNAHLSPVATRQTTAHYRSKKQHYLASGNLRAHQS